MKNLIFKYGGLTLSVAGLILTSISNRMDNEKILERLVNSKLGK